MSTPLSAGCGCRRRRVNAFNCMQNIKSRRLRFAFAGADGTVPHSRSIFPPDLDFSAGYSQPLEAADDNRKAPLIDLFNAAGFWDSAAEEYPLGPLDNLISLARI
ncbi:uncharacterized protein LOC108098552 [Drosophila ficusphila]|uniref:uncharacterized protein LOC108098552 n=1 Tax=Drosophila ficusphila TaxID=30025 RepID=UPI0007E7394D|nr:uncharacterized protein LOC108098552 [Drosophila ficusphila]